VLLEEGQPSPSLAHALGQFLPREEGQIELGATREVITVGEPEISPDVIEKPILSSRWQRVSDQIPRLTFVFDGLHASYEVEHTAGRSPKTSSSPEDVLRSLPEHV
jgi:hypothetical protein